MVYASHEIDKIEFHITETDGSDRLVLRRMDGEHVDLHIGNAVVYLPTSGAPTTGTWRTGQLVDDASGVKWYCTAGGSPGLWVKSGAYVPYDIPAAASQGFIAAPVSQTILLQAAIDAKFNSGGGEVRVAPGVFYGSIKMRPSVDLIGSGWQTVIRAVPGQVVPILDYATYNAYHTRVANLRIDGNYISGRTDGATQGNCRAINMDTTPTARTGFMFGNPSIMAPVLADGSPIQGLAWNDACNSIERLLITACNADYAVYLGVNQNGTWIRDTFIYACNATAMGVFCTDSEFVNLQAGSCSDGIVIHAQNNKFVNCKSWYHGVNAGLTGIGDGWRVVLPDATTYGAIQLTGCESQDNHRYGLAILVGTGVVAKGFLSGGDSGAALYLNTAKNNDIDMAIQYADRAQDTIGVYFDTVNPVGNRIRWTINNQIPGIGTFTPYFYANGYAGYGNDIEGPFEQQGLVLLALNNVFTPTSCKNYMAGAFTGAITVANPSFYGVPAAIQSGEEMTIIIYDSVGGHAVTWGSAYRTGPLFNTTANKFHIFKFMYVGGIWVLIASELAE